MLSAAERLTAMQRAVLEFVTGHVGSEGRFPTVREVCARFGFASPTPAHQHLRALVRKGYLAHGNRRFSLPKALRRQGGVPIVGRVAAGRPIAAVEHVEGYLGDDYFGPACEVFLVRVVGESMQDAGILDGDLVAVRAQPDAAEGQVVVAYVGELQEATVKRFSRDRQGRVVLLPAHPGYAPLVVDRDDPWFRIGGVMVGLVRRRR